MKIILVYVLFFMLTACGGDSSDEGNRGQATSESLDTEDMAFHLSLQLENNQTLGIIVELEHAESGQSLSLGSGDGLFVSSGENRYQLPQMEIIDAQIEGVVLYSLRMSKSMLVGDQLRVSFERDQGENFSIDLELDTFPTITSPTEEQVISVSGSLGVEFSGLSSSAGWTSVHLQSECDYEPARLVNLQTDNYLEFEAQDLEGLGQCIIDAVQAGEEPLLEAILTSNVYEINSIDETPFAEALVSHSYSNRVAVSLVE